MFYPFGVSHRVQSQNSGLTSHLFDDVCEREAALRPEGRNLNSAHEVFHEGSVHSLQLGSRSHKWRQLASILVVTFIEVLHEQPYLSLAMGNVILRMDVANISRANEHIGCQAVVVDSDTCFAAVSHQHNGG